MHKIALVVFLSSIGCASFAQLSQTTPTCPVGTTTCTGSNQNSGDTSTTTNSGETHSSASQMGNSSASNASGATVNPNFDNRAQTTQNATNTTTGTISGGNTGPSSATGNVTSADNKSSVGNTSTGASTATNGNNSNGANSNGSNSNGPQTLTGGANTNSTGGNTMLGGSNDAKGGAGGQGGQGGAASSNGTNAQQQGIAGSGNSDVKNNNSNGQGQSSDNKNQSTNQVGVSSDVKNNVGQGQSSAVKNTVGQGQTSDNRSGAAQGQSSKQGQSSEQGQGQSNDGSGNSRTMVDASDRSVYNNKTIFIPAIIPPTPPSSLAVGNVIKETSACGPLQRVVEREVNGTFHGLFITSDVHQGYSQELAPYLNDKNEEVQYKQVPLLTGDGYTMFGHQVTQYTTVVGVSGARNIALGGGSSGGSWGQGGMGSSSANQQMVTTLQLRLCEIGTIRQQPIQFITSVEKVMVEVARKPKKE